MPYYNTAGKITKWEKITNHNIDKYVVLSKDIIDIYLHTPIKTLLFIIKFPACDHNMITTKLRYKKYYLSKAGNISVRISAGIFGSFGKATVLNDYEMFIKKIVYYFKSI